jgi:hypothetical protein
MMMILLLKKINNLFALALALAFALDFVLVFVLILVFVLVLCFAYVKTSEAAV